MKKNLLTAIILIFSIQSIYAQTLVHYWNFNLFDTEANHLAPSYSTGGASLAYIAGGSSVNSYTAGTGQNFNVQNLNARNGDAFGNHLRINNPIGASLIFSIPTTGFSDVIFKYATKRSAQGAGTQVIEYTTDGTNYIQLTTINPNNGDPTLQTLDFSGISATDNNPDLKIRFTFLLGPGGIEGNNRFDNVTLDGTPTGADVLPPSVTFTPVSGSIDMPLNTVPAITFNEAVRNLDNTPIDNTNADDLVIFKLTNASGTDVAFNAVYSGYFITISPLAPLSNNQQYYVALKPNTVEDMSNNAVTTVQSSAFTTIAAQTVFNPGDLLMVAYQMNSIPNNDRIAFVTFVDILPGTKINFTDAKYTTNVPAQCTGGFVWTAPAAGITAGTVVTINNDGGTADAGTITGSTFGLSANGDQVIVYTGTAASPNFITALSSNAWVASNTSCGNSLSMLPASLTDDVNSINLSMAPGNTAGNTVNAYYAGTMNGTTAELKAAVTNPANWIGTASATPAQTWPAWAFPGPPVVTASQVINGSTIRIVFNRDLDPVSAVNINNFTDIPGLTSIDRTDNGMLNDTLLLNYTTPFSSGTMYTLNIAGVKDSESRTMAAPYTFTFTYNTVVSFNVSTLSVPEGSGQINIQLNLTNPSAASVDLVIKGAPFSTAGASDFTLSTQTLNFTAASNSTQMITVPVIDDGNTEQDEYFVVTLENPVGLTVGSNQFISIYIRDNDRVAPVATKEIELSYIGSYDPSGSSNASTEIVVYDSASKRLFVISALQDRLDIADFSNPASIQPVGSIDMAPYGGITSVAVKNGIVAASSPNANEQLNGSVVFFNTDGIFQKQVIVGALPDMITFTPDGLSVLTANEGQPNDSYTVDPEGSVSIIDISGGIASLNQSNVTTLDFTSFNAQTAALLASGIRKGFPGSTLSQDLEPEYITISPDSKKAWVILQEANAFAVLDLVTKTFTEIWPLGKKDHNVPGNGFDASDRGTNAHISNWPVKGLYMPDGIANYTVNGTSYIVGANEGDDREYSAFNERLRINDPAYVLDPVIFPNATILKNDNNIGRLRVTKASGDTDGDGDFDEIHLIGGRSFSIWNSSTRSIVYDSKDDFEQYLSKTPLYAPIFNADHESNAPRSRSTSKGPEPEGLVLASIRGKEYAFVSLERQGGVMVYDITDPSAVKFVDYNNPRNLASYGGDNGPEGIFYIADKDSPDGNHYIVVANEISGSLSVYRLAGNVSNIPPEISIVFPTNNMSFSAGTKIELNSIATDGDGYITRVEFYNDGVQFAADSTFPYQYIADGVEPGNYVLTAKAFDNEGDSAISDTVRVVITQCISDGLISAEGFTNIPGSALVNLASDADYPNNPDVVTAINKFEYGPDYADSYGGRLRGFICVPQTGNYVFYIASDEQSELWLSTDDNPANIRRIAYVHSRVNFRSWYTYATQRSVAIRLIKGARYYIETIHKEGTGTDHLSVGWVLPNGVFEAPIPGSRLSPFLSYPPAVTSTSAGVEFGEALRNATEPAPGANVTGLQVAATPNPSSGYFTLRTKSNSDERLTITMTDIQGRVVEKRAQVTANGYLEIGNRLPAGVYFVEVVQGSQVKRLKLIRQ